MLESWKETEAVGDEDDSDDSDDQGTEEHFIPDAVALVVQEEEKLNAELKESQVAIDNHTETSKSTTSEETEATLNSTHVTNIDSYANSSLQEMTDPWIKSDTLFDIFNQLYSSSQSSIICQTADAPTAVTDLQATSTSETSDSSTTESENPATAITPATACLPEEPATKNATDPATSENSAPSESAPASTETLNASSSSHEPSPTTASLSSKSQNITSAHKNKTTTSTSSAASSLPTIQESFFKAVSRRLQLLEANSTLSLKYIEEQSRILREAFTKVEKKQLQKADTFLDTLNNTVLEELRGFRQQYDEIWQSTVISLESQREESKREILAVSTRLNILADEVVFQRRMAIVQSVLLLLCLGLIIFSRVSAGGALDFPGIQARSRNSAFQVSPGDSPLESISLRRTNSMGNHDQWLDPQGGRQGTDEYPISRSRSREDSPPTPVSTYSQSDNALTPPSGGDDPLTASASNRVSGTSDLEPSSQSTTTSPRSAVLRDRSINAESTYLSPSSAGTLRRKQGLGKEQWNQSASEIHHDLGGGSQSSIERRWIGQEIRHEGGSPHLPSPPPETENEEIEEYIAGKPLPALPQHDD